MHDLWGNRTQSRRPLRLLIGPAVAASLALGHTAVAQQAPPAGGTEAITWGIRPSTANGPDGRDRFDLTLDPGQVIEDYVGVSNFTTAPLSLDVYASDAFTTPDGGFDLLPAAKKPVDAGDWVTFAQRTFVVPPRARLDIPFRLAVPKNATPGDHAAGIVASLASTGADTSGNPLTVDRRVGARVYLRVSGDIKPAVTVSDVSVDHAASGLSGNATVSYTVTNTGNLRLTGTPTISVAGLFGLARKTVDGREIKELLPGNKLAFTATVDGVLPLARLKATVALDAKGVADDTKFPKAEASASTWAVPWMYLVLIALVAAVVAAVLRVRRRRRRRIAAQIEAARAQGRAEAAKESE